MTADVICAGGTDRVIRWIFIISTCLAVHTEKRARSTKRLPIFAMQDAMKRGKWLSIETQRKTGG